MKKIKYILGATALASSALLAAPVNASNQETAQVKVTINETLSITLSNDDMNFDLSGTSLQIQDLTITGATNNGGGYTISYNVNNDYSELKHNNSLISANIPNLTEDATEATFPATAWGYSLDAENFHASPLTSTKIFETSASGSNDHIFTAGVRAAADLTSGNYSNDLLFTIVGNLDAPHSEDPSGGNGGKPTINPNAIDISKITYMQEMNSDVKDSMILEKQYQLKDIRDGKTYWIAKLKDGNVWMTQNLDFDITEDNVTPEFSDVTEAWTASSTYAPITTLTSLEGGHFTSTDGTNGPTYSYDPGDYYWTGIWDTDYKNSTIGYSDEIFTQITTTAPEQGGEHYHIGNFYQWNAATAGTGVNTEVFNPAPSSICPKGWKLPTSKNSTSEALSEAYYAKLWEAYGIPVGFGKGGQASISLSPIYITAAGLISAKKVLNAGIVAIYHTSVSNMTDNSSMWMMVSGKSGIENELASSLYVYSSASVRCVAR